jgi:hypothetical protein
MAKNSQDIEWDAEEYVVQEHNTLWFVLLAIITITLSGFSIWLGNWTFLAVIIIGVAAILVRVFMPPRKIHYSMSSSNLIEDKIVHEFSDYKSFAILKEGSHYSAILIPKKRLALQVKVYFPERNGEEIVDMLGAKLPMTEPKLDFLDKLVKFLRI